jgi:hypothetical protein
MAGTGTQTAALVFWWSNSLLQELQMQQKNIMVLLGQLVEI